MRMNFFEKLNKEDKVECVILTGVLVAVIIILLT